MGIDYSFYLRVGFEIGEKDVLAPFRKETKEEGSFHMEDRFNEKTGVKLTPVKVWDKKPKSDVWYEIDGEETDDDPESVVQILAERVVCNVDHLGDSMNGDMVYVFYPHEHGKRDIDEGHVSVYNAEMTYEDVEAMSPQLQTIRSRLEKLGLDPGEPKVFVASMIG